MGKNNQLINNLREIAKRNRENNIKTAANRTTPQYCAAACIALKRISENVTPSICKDFLLEMHDVMNQYPNVKNLVDQCRSETGVVIKLDEDKAGL